MEWSDDTSPRDQPLHPILAAVLTFPLRDAHVLVEPLPLWGQKQEGKQNIQRANRECSAPSPVPHQSSEQTKFWCCQGGLATKIQPFIHSFQAVSSSELHSAGKRQETGDNHADAVHGQEANRTSNTPARLGAQLPQCGRAGFPSRPVPPLLRSFASRSEANLSRFYHQSHWTN